MAKTALEILSTKPEDNIDSLRSQIKAREVSLWYESGFAKVSKEGR